MTSPRFISEFKEEAVRQTVDRGYSVAEGEPPSPFAAPP